jgi:hypothetical protein
MTSDVKLSRWNETKGVGVEKWRGSSFSPFKSGCKGRIWKRVQGIKSGSYFYKETRLQFEFEIDSNHRRKNKGQSSEHLLSEK